MSRCPREREEPWFHEVRNNPLEDGDRPPGVSTQSETALAIVREERSGCDDEQLGIEDATTVAKGGHTPSARFRNNLYADVTQGFPGWSVR